MMPKILIVDDDPVFRSQCKTYLESEFFTVAVAEDGEAALRMLDSVAPDIMILDVSIYFNANLHRYISPGCPANHDPGDNYGLYQTNCRGYRRTYKPVYRSYGDCQSIR
jgi:hypothetical protein